MKPFRLYHAPWSKRFKTFVLKGAVAYELQLGPFVFQLFYKRHEHFGRLHFWRDQFWSI